MKYAFAICLLLTGFITAVPARAAGHLAEVGIIDRDTGQRLKAYYHHGEYWVAGEPGVRYAMYIRSRLGDGRLMAVASVDGVNVITGQDASWDQAGYVLAPGEDYQITGWRKSDAQVAEFAFTAAPRSYAARTGRPDNVGIIGVALFREQPTVAAPPPPAPPIASAAPVASPRSPPILQRAQREAPSEAQADAATSAESKSSNLVIPAPAAAPSLGTAHGAREYSYVAHTHFVRRQWRPDEIIRIRYDSLENLIAMGIVRPHRYPDRQPSPFPESHSELYVPDPPPPLTGHCQAEGVRARIGCQAKSNCGERHAAVPPAA